MNLIDFQFVGPPCGQHGPYTFYKGFSCQKNGHSRNISLGEFFFLKISPADEVCIGELQLLWEDKNSQLTLSSSRLYYLPENTPCGRHGHHGQDEVLAVSMKAVLRLEDLVDWMVDDVEWDKGLPGLLEETSVPDKDALVEAFTENNVEVEEPKNGHLRETKGPPSLSILSYPRYCRYRAILKRLENVTDEWVKNTLVKALGGFTFPSRNHRVLFCRDTFDHPTLETHHSLVNYLGEPIDAPNLKGRPRKKRLKGRRGQSPSSESNASEESKDYRETPRLNKVRIEIFRSNGMKKCRLEETCGEQEFLQKLFKFMQERNTPIERVPHLGFKQINLFLFYTYAQKLGGYEKITIKKLWKQIYDELGGNPGSTSAATCTRRHYERLLLPYERFTKGEEDKPLPPPVKHRRASTTLKNKKKIEMQNMEDKTSANDLTTLTITSSAISTPTTKPISSSPTEISDRKSLSPSLTPNPPLSSITPLDDMDLPDLDSPEPLSPSPPSPPTLTVSIPSPASPSQSITERTPSPLPSIDTKPLELATETRPDPELRTKEQEWEERKRKLPQPRKRLRDDRYSEKERQWDEIRRQNALERDRVKQLSAVARTSGRLMKLRDHISESERTSPISPDSPKCNPDNGASQQLQSTTPLSSSPPTLALSVTEGSSQDSKDMFLSASPAPENLPPPPPLLDLTRAVNSMAVTNSEKESKPAHLTVLHKSPEQNSSEAQDLSIMKSIKVENEENQKPQEVYPLMQIPSPNLSRRTSFSVPSAAGGYVTLHPVLSSKINSVNHHHNHHPLQVVQLDAKSKASSELAIKAEPEAKASSSIPRPSVIQHTQKACHSLNSTPSPVSLSVSPLPIGNNTSFMRKSLDNSASTHTKSLSDNELSSHNNTNIHSSQYYSHRFYPYSQISTQLVTNLQPHVEPLKRPYLEPPIVTAPKYYPAPRVYGQPMAYRGSPYVSHLFQVSGEAENGEVLDLRVTKNKTEEKVEKPESKAPYPFWEYESITPPDRELDLSVKNKSTPPLNDQTLNNSSHNSHTFNSHNNTISQKEPLEQIKGASTSKMVTVTPVVRSDERQTGTREPVLIEQADTPDSKGSTKPATPHSSASQSAQAYAYLPPGGKSSYYSDYPNHFPPGLYSSSLYGFSTQFLTSSSRPVSSEQLQASLAVYKDMVQRGYYHPSYPYPVPSQFYPQVYKEGQQYIYPPK